MGAITGTGWYAPERVVPSEEVAERLGVSADWIVRRTGIRQRRFAAKETTVADLAERAGRAAVEDAGTDPSAIDVVVLATSTAASPMPNTAAGVAHRLGLRSPAAFDVNAACSGFCHALACADGFARAGTARNVLVVGADKSSDWLDHDDPDTAALFADGAGAAVVTASDQPRIGPVVWGSAGEHEDLVAIEPSERVIRQEGRAVFRWASGLAPVAREACRRGGVDPAELAGFVPHQANGRIIDALVRELGLGPTTAVARDVEQHGNTIAATVPMALARMARSGAVAAGTPVLLFGFGAGLAYAGQVVRL